MITAYINRHGHIITLTECGARARLVPGIGMEDDTGDVYPYEGDGALEVAASLSGQTGEQITVDDVRRAWAAVHG